MKSGRRWCGGLTKAELCAAAGCKCYCHEPAPRESIGKIILGIFFVIIAYALMLFVLSMDRPKTNMKCDHISPTGAPVDCHDVR